MQTKKDLKEVKLWQEIEKDYWITDYEMDNVVITKDLQRILVTTSKASGITPKEFNTKKEALVYAKKYMNLITKMI